MNDQICTALNINHICLAVRDIEETLYFYQNRFGIGGVEIKNIEDQRVKAALVEVGNTQLEFIQPTDTIGGVARFIERRGEGMHHICFEVEELQDKRWQVCTTVTNSAAPVHLVILEKIGTFGVKFYRYFQVGIQCNHGSF